MTKAEKLRFARRLRAEMTPAERRLLAALRKRKATLGRVWPQHVVRGWIVDFYFPGARLAVECNGAMHDRRADLRRDEILEREAGIRTLRFPNSEILYALPEVLGRIRRAIERTK